MKIKENKIFTLELTFQELRGIRALAYITLEADERGIGMFEENRQLAKEDIMNIELNHAECHVVKDLFPGMLTTHLSRWQMENIIDKVEDHIFGLEIGETRSVCANTFHKIAIAIDGEEGKSYIEPADDTRLFNLVLTEE